MESINTRKDLLNEENPENQKLLKGILEGEKKLVNQILIMSQNGMLPEDVYVQIIYPRGCFYNI